MLGFNYVPYAMLWRLAGADQMHVNGLGNKSCEPDASVIASARSMLVPVLAGKPCLAMPVFSSGRSVMHAAETYAVLGSTDLIYATGGGIMAHHGSPAALGLRRWHLPQDGGALPPADGRRGRARRHPDLGRAASERVRSSARCCSCSSS
jgi:ribulose 1,5-bisphosphate carboxylase large subunit-like protein